MRTISFQTLGCRANQAETQQMQQAVVSAGYVILNPHEKADICVINTCTVTSVADKKSRQAIRNAVKKKAKKVIVTGCGVETNLDELKAISGIDLFLNNSDKTSLPSFLPKSNNKVSPGSFLNKVRANVLIQNGCNNFCSYCIVPYARGKEQSRDFNEIIEETKALAKSGVKEIILTGINIGAFEKLSKLIVEISGIKEILRIRLSSIEPNYITEELIKTISKNPKVCHFLHIPLQSGDNEVLKNMGRKHSSSEYEKLIKMIRKYIPYIAITTDIIVGFPGETDNQFKNTMDFVKKTGFTRLHVFRYSKRKCTPAAELKNQVSSKEILKRSSQMQCLKKDMMLGYHKSFIGKTMEILVEQVKDNGDLEGLTSTFVRVLSKGQKDLLGKIVPVKITKASAENLSGIFDP